MKPVKKTVKPAFENECYEVQNVQFEEPQKGKLLSACLYLLGFFLNHQSNVRVVPVCGIAACAFIAWAIRDAPLTALGICLAIVALCATGVILEYVCETQKVSASPSRPEPEVSRNAGATQRIDEHEPVRSPAKIARSVRSRRSRTARRRKGSDP